MARTNEPWIDSYSFTHEDGTPLLNITGMRFRLAMTFSKELAPVLQLDTNDGSLTIVDGVNCVVGFNASLAQMAALETYFSSHDKIYGKTGYCDLRCENSKLVFLVFEEPIEFGITK